MRIFQYFASALRLSLSPPHVLLASTTISQYISQAVFYLISCGAIVDASSIRVPLLRYQLDGYSRHDAVGRPQRLTVKIPVTYSIVLEFVAELSRRYAARAHPLWWGLSAAIALGYGLSLRPSEYLVVSRPVDGDRYVNASMSFFLWAGHPTPVSVCTPALFPPGPPSTFLTFLDFIKNDARGKGGPRAMCADPCGPTSPFCVVTALWEFLRRFPPTPGGSIFQGLPVALTDSLVNQVLKSVARRLQLDPSRLVPHGLRVAGPVQLSAFPDAVKMAQGNWRSVEGMLAYARGSLTHASMVAAAMHDESVLPIDILQLSYSLPSVTRTSTSPHILS